MAEKKFKETDNEERDRKWCLRWDSPVSTNPLNLSRDDNPPLDRFGFPLRLGAIVGACFQHRSAPCIYRIEFSQEHNQLQGKLISYRADQDPWTLYLRRGETYPYVKVIHYGDDVYYNESILKECRGKKEHPVYMWGRDLKQGMRIIEVRDDFPIWGPFTNDRHCDILMIALETHGTPGCWTRYRKINPDQAYVMYSLTLNQ